jgi:putative transposase
MEIVMAQRKRHTAEFKAKMALEALREQMTINEQAGKNGVHPVQISQWKKHALDNFASLFLTSKSRSAKEDEALKDELFREIGQLKVELDWLKKKSGLTHRR